MENGPVCQHEVFYVGVFFFNITMIFQESKSFDSNSFEVDNNHKSIYMIIEYFKRGHMTTQNCGKHVQDALIKKFRGGTFPRTHYERNSGAVWFSLFFSIKIKLKLSELLNVLKFRNIERSEKK